MERKIGTAPTLVYPEAELEKLCAALQRLEATK